MAGIGSAAGMLVAVGVGGAASQALEPDFIDIRQNSWKDNQKLVLEPDVLAALVAQGGIDLAAGAEQATYSGISSDRFDALVFLEQRVPGAAELLFLWRYGIIAEAEFRKGMAKSGLRAEYIDAIAKTFSLPLDAGAIATAVHRGIMNGTGLILQEPPTAPGNVAIVPPSNLDPVAQAQALGISHEQLRILVGNTGLPLSLGEMLQLLNRKVVTEDDVKRAVAESNLRNEYMDVAVALRRRLLTPHEYAELQLRGYLSKDERDAGAALSGMEPADAELLYDVLGRSIPVHQIVTGEARGGTYNGDHSQIPEAFLTSLERGNLRPEYYSLAYANRYSYPSGFQLRAETQNGDLSQAEAEQILLEVGWVPKWAKLFSEKWAAKAGGSTDPHVAKARTTAWTKAQSAYLAGGAVASDVQPILTALDIPAEAQTEIIGLWDEILTMQRRQLSASQVAKAYKGNVTNPATGAPWTEQDAISRLVELGYSVDDAKVLLAE